MGQDAKLQHRLAAIMATDVVGYSQSMQADEAGTLAALSAIRQATEGQIRQTEDALPTRPAIACSRSSPVPWTQSGARWRFRTH